MAHKTCAHMSEAVSHAPLSTGFTEHMWFSSLRQRRREILAHKQQSLLFLLLCLSSPSAPISPFQETEEMAAMLLHFYGYANDLIHI